MTHTTLQQLIARFLDGETTLQEERQLYAYFQQPDIPVEWEAYRSLFVGFAAIDGVDREGALPAPRAINRWLKPIGIAASIVVAASLAFTFNHAGDTTICVTRENGHVTTDQAIALSNMETAMQELFSDDNELDIKDQLKYILLQ